MLDIVRHLTTWLSQVELPDTVTALLWITLFWLPLTRALFVWIPRRLRRIKSTV